MGLLRLRKEWRFLDWCIIGGESAPRGKAKQGVNCRPFDVAWGEQLIDQCDAMNISVYVKQLGALPGHWGKQGRRGESIWRPLELRDVKGGDPGEWPRSLRRRDYPDGNCDL